MFFKMIMEIQFIILTYSEVSKRLARQQSKKASKFVFKISLKIPPPEIVYNITG